MKGNAIRLAILVVGIIVAGLIYFGISFSDVSDYGEDQTTEDYTKTNQSCSEHYYVGCYDQDFETTEDYISCQTDDDCQEEELFNYCYPDNPDLIWCDQGYYYCEDEVCVLCDCPISESDIETVNDYNLN